MRKCLLSHQTKAVLELGSGENPYQAKKGEKVIHLDKFPLKGIDVIHDLNDLPLPFRDNSFDIIHARHVFEHIRELPNLLMDSHRILRPGGLIICSVPYAFSHYAFISLEHCQFFVWNTFDAFCKHEFNRYGGKGKLIIFEKKFEMISKVPGKRLILWFANKFPRFYERFLSRILTVDEIQIKLKKQE